MGITHNRAKLYARRYATTGKPLILYFLPVQISEADSENVEHQT